jgi:predicted DNA-binding protein
MPGYDSDMRRPPLKVKSTVIRLPIGLGERIDKLVGPQRRAAFIREVVEREVDRLEKKEAEAARPG